MGFFSSIWNAIKRILAIVLIIIAIVLIVIAIVATGGSATVGFLTYTLGTAELVALAIIAGIVAYMLDSDVVIKALAKVGEFLGAVAGAIGSAGAAVAGGLISGLLTNPIVAVGVGLGLYLWFTRSKKSDDDDRYQKRVSQPQSSFVTTTGSSAASSFPNHWDKGDH
jgi:hypothetical protein